MKGMVKYLFWVYYAACFAYVGYAWYSYSGLYRLAAEWQMDMFGSYSMKMTLLIPLVVLVVPGAVAAKMLGVDDRFRGSVDTFMTSSRVVLVLGVTLVAVALAAGWYGYQKASETVAFETVDLSKNQAPKSTHVVMIAIAHTEYQLEFQRKSGGSTTVDRYIPLTPATWRRGDPLIYFMKTNATAYLPPEGGRFFEFSQRTPPFPLTTQPGVLIENDLPGPIAEAYRKHNVAIASPPVVLDLNTGADVKPYFITAGVSGIFGFICLLVAAMTAMRQRRLPQT